MQRGKRWPLEASILNLAGYHYKNAYMVKHWAAVQAGRPPADRLLGRSERYFFESFFVDPHDYSTLNGIGNVLFFSRDLDAAEFFMSRAVRLAKRARVRYAAAENDLQMVRALKHRK